MASVAAEAARVRRAGGPRALWRPLRGSAMQGLALLGGVVLWEAFGWLLALPWLPPFSKVVAALGQLIQSGEILGNLAVSLRTLVVGFSLSLVVGLVVGALMGRYRRVEQAIGIYVNALLFTPSLVFAPIFFAFFHLSDWTRIAVIVKYVVFILIINTATAIRTTDPALVEMARSFGATERQIFLRILLPASLLIAFAGIRLGVGRAVKGMITGEMFIAFVGLGGVVQKYGSQFDASRVLAISLVILVVALVLGTAVQALDRRLTRWAD
ncbi:MAG: ABC transporter permease subunit [Chloroflexi bacterium]|nr:ABC transporter permease subunit [Chloroflexota bacterium]